jgi:hypothetical protein
MQRLRVASSVVEHSAFNRLVLSSNLRQPIKSESLGGSPRLFCGFKAGCKALQRFQQFAGLAEGGLVAAVVIHGRSFDLGDHRFEAVAGRIRFLVLLQNRR